VALTQSLALEFAPSVRVNAVLPGAVDTPMLRDGISGRAADAAEAKRRTDSLKASAPLRRIGSPEEIAASILFLADAAQSGFMSGASLVVDGGVLSGLKSE
jgi:NAD(P)-dependent dehydrogenase (short-subunit alcohol dehydrogenase family)